MNGSLGAVVWKELRGVKRQLLGDSWSHRLLLALVLLNLGVFFPAIAGAELMVSPGLLALYPMLGASVIIQMAIDAFAGERERRTLEGLLATPLSPAAIVWGKALTFAAFGTVYALGLWVTAWGTVIALDPAALPEVASETSAGVLLLTPALVAVATTGGMVASLHARTVREGMQVFGYLILIASLGPVLLVVLAPELQRSLVEWLVQLDLVPAATASAALAWLVSALFIGWMTLRFRWGPPVVE